MKKIIKITSALSILFALSSCGGKTPEPILLHKDACAGCKMSISEGNFATELITKKGRVYKFDDVLCMNAYVAENDAAEIEKFYVGDYLKDNELIDATTAWYVHSEQIKSPMGGHIAAFSDKAAAEQLAGEYETHVKNWNEIKSMALSEKTNEYYH